MMRLIDAIAIVLFLDSVNACASGDQFACVQEKEYLDCRATLQLSPSDCECVACAVVDGVALDAAVRECTYSGKIVQ